MRTHRLAAIGATLLALPALAQNNPPPAVPPAGGEDRSPVARERLERRMEELSQEQDRLRSAIGLLDQGASREEVMRALRPAGPEGEAAEPGDRPWDRWMERRERSGPDDRPHGLDGSGRPPEAERTDWRAPENRDRVVAFLRDHLPEVAARFERLGAANPEFAQRLLSRVGPRVGEVRALQEREPELARLKLAELGNALSIIDAFKQAREAKDDPAQLGAAREVLAARVADQVDIRARLHQHEIGRLRQRLDRLQSDFEAQRARRDEDIQKRTDEMMSGKAPMDLFGDGTSRRGTRDGPDGPDRPRRDDPQRSPK